MRIAAFIGSFAVLQASISPAQCRVDTVPLGYDRDHIYAGEGRLYIPLYQEMMHIFEIHPDSMISDLGIVALDGHVDGVVGDGALAHVFQYDVPSGQIFLEVIEFLPDGTRSLVGSTELPHRAFNGCVQDGILYYSSYNEIVSVDVKDPTSPVVLDVLPRVDGFHCVVEQNKLLVVENRWVYIVDVSEPAELVEVGRIEGSIPGYSLYLSDVASRDNMVVVANFGGRDTDRGLRFYDISNPAEPVLHTVIETPANPGHLSFHNDTLYCTQFSNDALIVDIQNLIAPRLAGVIPLASTDAALAITEDTLLTISDDSLVSYNLSGSCEPCTADANGDGVLSPNDFTAWIAAYQTGRAAADQNLDGVVDPTDFTAWIANFNAGC